MAYILIKMCVAPHVLFKILTMVYIFFKMHLAPHVLFRTLVMAYVPFETCLALATGCALFKTQLALAIVNIFIKMHLAHNNILDVSFETQTKIHCVF